MTLPNSASFRAFALTSLALAGLFSSALPASAADYKLTILHVSDLQSRLEPVTESGGVCSPEDSQAHRCFGGMARLASRIRTEKASAANVIVVGTGNALTGSQFYDHHKQRAISETMNLIGFDAMTVGDREFADGTEMLASFQQAVRFPLLGANVDVQRDPFMRDRIYPILVTDRGADRIGLIGYSTEHLIEFAHPTGVVRIDSIDFALNRWVKQMEMMGVNKIIAISHAGADRDRQVAATIEGIDVIVGSHSGGAATGAATKPVAGHYPTVVKGPTGHPVLLVQAGEYGHSLGRLDVTFDGKGVAKVWKGEPIEINDTIAEDPSLKEVVSSLAASFASLPVAADKGRVQ